MPSIRMVFTSIVDPLLNLSVNILLLFFVKHHVFFSYQTIKLSSNELINFPLAAHITAVSGLIVVTTWCLFIVKRAVLFYKEMKKNTAEYVAYHIFDQKKNRSHAKLSLLFVK